MISLRDYQEERCAGAVAELIAGRSCAIVLPTGTGKTRTALATCNRVLSAPTAQAGRALWLVDRRPLVTQTEKAAVELGVPVEVKTIQGLSYRSKARCKGCDGKGTTEVAPDWEHSETTTRTCIACDGSGKLKLTPIKPGDYDIIVCDEAHKFLTDIRMRILREAETPCLLLTATPKHGNGQKHIEDLFGPNYVGGPYTISQAITDGWLCDALVKRLELRELDLREIKNAGGDFDKAELAEAMNVPSINEEIVNRWREQAVCADGYMVSNFFCVDTAHADAMADEVNRQLGEGSCVSIHSNLAGSLADERIAGFLAGEWRYVASVMMIAEGFDYPAIQCGVLARPTKSERLLVQMLGRFLRPHESKLHALILDCNGAYETLDITRIYDAVEPSSGSMDEPTLSSDGGVVDELDAIPMLAEVMSRIRAVDLFRRKCQVARERDEWVFAPKAMTSGAYVLPLHGNAALVVAKSKHDAAKVGVAVLFYDRGAPCASTLQHAVSEPDAFAAAESWAISRNSTTMSPAKAAAFVNKWFVNRGPPSDRLVAKLVAVGRDPLPTHYQSVKLLRRLYASGEMTR